MTLEIPQLKKPKKREEIAWQRKVDNKRIEREKE
jgi:hypothetical protein